MARLKLMARPWQPVNVLVESAVGTTLVVGVVTLGTSAAALASSPTRNKSGFWLRADLANTAVVYIGGSDASATKGYPLAAGDAVHVAIEDLANVYAMSPSSNQILRYLGVDSR